MNSAEPDQTPQNAASEQGLHCLLTECSIKVRKTAKIRNQYNQVPHLTQDTTRESDKITIKHHKQEQNLNKIEKYKQTGRSEWEIPLTYII